MSDSPLIDGGGPPHPPADSRTHTHRRPNRRGHSTCANRLAEGFGGAQWAHRSPAGSSLQTTAECPGQRVAEANRPARCRVMGAPSRISAMSFAALGVGAAREFVALQFDLRNDARVSSMNTRSTASTRRAVRAVRPGRSIRRRSPSVGAVPGHSLAHPVGVQGIRTGPRRTNSRAMVMKFGRVRGYRGTRIADVGRALKSTYSPGCCG